MKYNTCFWALVESGKSNQEAEQLLKSDYASSALKNELLFREFNRNYNNEPAISKKGSVLFRRSIGMLLNDDDDGDGDSPRKNKDGRKDDEEKMKKKREIVIEHIDIIKDVFWNNNKSILD